MSDVKTAITTEHNCSAILKFQQKNTKRWGHARDKMKFLDLNNKAQGHGKHRMMKPKLTSKELLAKYKRWWMQRVVIGLTISSNQDHLQNLKVGIGKERSSNLVDQLIHIF